MPGGVGPGMMHSEQPLSLSQQAYQDIRQKIISLQLAPGDVIDETALQDELGLGRTPIREALQRLALEKLVSIVPRRGMFVSEIGVTDLKQLFELRVPLEDLAARLAARRGTEEHWQRMDAILAGIPDSDPDADNEKLIYIDESWHHALYDAAGNPFLRDTLHTFYALSLRFWYLLLPSIADMTAAVQEHAAILEALRAGDEDLAASRLRTHIQTFQLEIQAQILAG